MVIMIPATQIAVQLVGPDQLTLNRAKPVHRPGPTQILGQVECIGLCFSDMKLLHQFDLHARKSPVLAHLGAEVLKEIPSYVPNQAPTVPGHEVVIRVVEKGAKVKSVEVGRRYLVQADWRDLKTASSNGAFGYNFEGGLQQFTLLDERVTIAADGTSYLLPVDNQRSASATALVEPWACIEDAFIHHERTALTPGGTLLVVETGGAKADLTGVDLAPLGRRLCLGPARDGFTGVERKALAKESVTDLVVTGADADALEGLLPLLAKNGLLVALTVGARFGRPVNIPIGRVHYGNVRLVGSTGLALAAALATIPATGEVRPGHHVHVVGAAGPMGLMAVIRLVSLTATGLYVEGSDMAEERLAVLRRKAEPVAAKRGTKLRLFNPKKAKADGEADYHLIMVPVPALVAEAVTSSRPRGLINIFAGIAADVVARIDLDTYCERGLYFIGTSGSTMEDMNAVLAKVVAGDLDTNLSVGAISGMGGAIDGLTAVKKGSISGKILVYPALGDFPLTSLDELATRHPTVGAKYENGCWTKAAEEELLKLAGKA
jgi:threonine dehydrogenase-like Zn-dependent dehydrogenase